MTPQTSEDSLRLSEWAKFWRKIVVELPVVEANCVCATVWLFGTGCRSKWGKSMTVGGLTVITIADNRMTNWPSQTQSAQSVVRVAHYGNNDARRKKRGGWILMNAQLRWLAAESIWADQSLLWKQNKTTFVCQTNGNFLLNKEAKKQNCCQMIASLIEIALKCWQLVSISGNIVFYWTKR